MNNFNWNNYIGEHMSEPLRVEYICLNNEKHVAELTGMNNDYLFLSTKNIEDVERYSKLCKPIIKSISDLTDEELLWVALHDKKLDAPTEVIKNRLFLGVQTGDCDITVLRNFDNVWKLTQTQWNSLYSLHVSLDYEELIKTNKAVRKI